MICFKFVVISVVIIFLISNITIVFAQYQPAPTATCLNAAGQATACQSFITIVGSEIVAKGGVYNGTITLASIVPLTANSSSTWIEWDIMIDADRNPNTNTWCSTPCTAPEMQLMVNGIGVDYVVRYWVSGLSNGAQICCTGGSWNAISSYQVTGNRILLRWFANDIGGSNFFNFMILARVYADSGNSLLVFDKAPNVGYYQFQNGTVTALPELVSSPIIAFVALIMAFGITGIHRKTRLLKK